MKRLIVLIAFIVFATIAANADDYYLCFTSYDNLFFAKIPGPGSHDEFDIVHSFLIDDSSGALTYDGENWWIYNEYSDSIYCFDQNGDYVRDFPNPGNRDVRGLAWDGQYLWIYPYYGEVCTRDIYGNPGPYGPFWAGYNALAVAGDKILGGYYADGIPAYADIQVHDFYGNPFFSDAGIGGYSYAAIYSLAYHDGIVWCSGEYNDSDSEYYVVTLGFYYDGEEDWEFYAVVHDTITGSLSVCDADFINITESSLGKIKAYFAEVEK